jgi:predicted O-linked N-acetylglucosamine transferase (SPINDLY family)
MDAAALLGEAGAHLSAGRLQEAVPALLRCLSVQPHSAEAWVSASTLLHGYNEAAGAAVCFEVARSISPGAHGVAGGAPSSARALSRRATSAKAHLPKAHLARLLAALGTTLTSTGPFEPAVALLRRALKLAPDLAPAHANLGAALVQWGRLDEGIASLRRALELQPEDAASHLNLGSALMKSALHTEALAELRRAVALRPADANFHSHLVGNLHYVPGVDAQALLEEARAWDCRHGLPLKVAIAAHPNDRGHDRRLRVGYVSPDFREHAQRFFTLPVLAQHDHESFEIFCYSNAPPDHVTARIRGHADHWRDVATVDDGAAAARIRQDGIDILVDLAMHTEKNRLTLFAAKPAPVQVCWLAYPGTTGLSAIDYRLTDRFFDPPELGAPLSAERTVWLPSSYWCYDPLARGPEVGPLPASTAGRMRFGCLNNFCKVNEPLLALWARVLRQVGDSTLLLLAPPGEARGRVRKTFAANGVDPGRLEFTEWRSHAEYLALYRDIDVALDPTPFCGGTTSLEALWMGVPVVTLVGSTVVGRGGLSLAQNVELPELVARSADEYVAIASGLARDLDRLATLRAGLRARLEASPLMDARGFTRALEAAFRGMWRSWCEA